MSIVQEPLAPRVIVGDTIFDRPDLAYRRELDTQVKSQVAGTPEKWDPKSVNKYYCQRLGPRFNRRFYLANYHTWIAPHFSEKVAGCFKRIGRLWKTYDADAVMAAHKVKHYISEAESDGIPNIIPALMYSGLSPSECRQKISKAAWRRVANNSLTRNRYLFGAAKVMGSDDLGPLMDLRSGALKYIASRQVDLGKKAVPVMLMAAKLSPTIDGRTLNRTGHLIYDTIRMLDHTGYDFNDKWSLSRIEREHDEATKRIRSSRFSSKPFADPFSVERGEWRADLLTSPIAIAEEGDKQRHCVSSYAGWAKNGKYAVFAVTGPERATLGLSKIKDLWHVDQIYGVCNEYVSEDARDFGEHVAGQYFKHTEEME